jgi:hypothetical protein
VELEGFLQQVRRRELPTVRFPITSQERPAFFILALCQRSGGIVVISLEMSKERLQRDGCRREQGVLSRRLEPQTVMEEMQRAVESPR